MSLDRQAAKAAGYTDAEIDAYEAEQKQKGASAAQVSGTEPPPPPPPSATQNQTNDVNYGELAYSRCCSSRRCWLWSLQVWQRRSGICKRCKSGHA